MLRTLILSMFVATALGISHGGIGGSLVIEIAALLRRRHH
jgi:hypothetical protein